MACVSEAVALAETDVADSVTSEDATVRELEDRLLGKKLVLSGEHFEGALRGAAPSSMRHLALSVEAPSTAWTDIGGQHAAKLALQVHTLLCLHSLHCLAMFGITTWAIAGGICPLLQLIPATLFL